MKSGTLVFDAFKMILTSAVYLALAVSFWIFLRLVYTCYMFPRVMRNLERGLDKKIDEMMRDAEEESDSVSERFEADASEKKNE